MDQLLVHGKRQIVRSATVRRVPAVPLPAVNLDHLGTWLDAAVAVDDTTLSHTITST